MNKKAGKFSFAGDNLPLWGRVLVRAMEWWHRRDLASVYDVFNQCAKDGVQESPWSTLARIVDLKMNFDQAQVNKIPKTGPVVVVANHPLGINDGIITGHIMASVRPDVKLIGHGRYNIIPEVCKGVLPVSFDNSGYTDGEAKRRVRQARQNIYAELDRGGSVVIFPAGHVSTTPSWSARDAIDSEWQAFASHMVLKTGADVVPMRIHAQNSRLFQLASHMSFVARQGLYLREAFRMKGMSVDVSVGDPISCPDLVSLVHNKYGDDREHLKQNMTREMQHMSESLEFVRPAQQAEVFEPAMQ